MMIHLLKLILLFFVLWYYHYYVVSESLDLVGRISNIGSGALLSGFSFVSFFYGKWFIFIYKRTRRRYGRREFFLENVIFPIAIFTLFGFPYLGIDLLNKTFLFCSALSVFLLFDPSCSMSEFLWKNRFHEYASYPESGVVQEFILKKNRWIIMGLFVFLPIANYFFKPLYDL